MATSAAIAKLKENPLRRFTLRQLVEEIGDVDKSELSAALHKLCRDRSMVTIRKEENPLAGLARARKTVNTYQWRMPWHS